MTIIMNERGAADGVVINRAAHSHLESRRSSKAANERYSANVPRAARVLSRVPWVATMEAGDSNAIE